MVRGVDVDALCDRTGGNPFFVTEVLASAQETVPPTVRDAVLARAARLSDAAFAVLGAAAVIGSHPEIDVLAAVADQPLAALDECLAAGMLVDGGGQVTFRHELAREAIASSLLPGRRQALHRAAYDALRGAGSEDDRRLAQHAAGAGDGPNVIVHAPRAAARAAALGAHREAAEHYRAALRWGHLLELAAAGRPAGAAVLRVLPDRAAAGGHRDPQRRARAAARRRGHTPHRRRAALDVAAVVVPAAQRRRRALRAGGRHDAVALPEGPELAMAYSNVAQIGMLGEDLAARRSGATAPSTWPAGSATSTPRSTR